MCGIAGVFDTSGVSEAEINRMLSVLEHRGPDDTGVCCRGPVGLGAKRLSIIDLEEGHQPLSNEAQDLQLEFNGMIYNYEIVKRDLQNGSHEFRSNTDSEVIMAALHHFFSLRYVPSPSTMFQGISEVPPATPC